MLLSTKDGSRVVNSVGYYHENMFKVMDADKEALQMFLLSYSPSKHYFILNGDGYLYADTAPLLDSGEIIITKQAIEQVLS